MEITIQKKKLKCGFFYTSFKMLYTIRVTSTLNFNDRLPVTGAVTLSVPNQLKNRIYLSCIVRI